MKKLVLAGALLGSLIAIPAAAQSVVNGSFESPSVGSPSYEQPGTTSGAGFEPNGGLFGYANAVDGTQILHLQGTGTATLSLIDMVMDKYYTVSFATAARPNYPVLPVSISYGDRLLGTFAPTSTAFTRLTGFTFRATDTMGTLTFAGLNPTASAANDQNTGIDDVTLAAAVPEPATWGMMILGFGLIGGAMRTAKRRSDAKFDLKIKRIAAGLEA